MRPKNLQALKLLPNYVISKDPSAILTKADKSNSLVVIYTTYYDYKIQSYLNDQTVHAIITGDHTDQFAD